MSILERLGLSREKSEDEDVREVVNKITLISFELLNLRDKIPEGTSGSLYIKTATEHLGWAICALTTKE